MHQSNSLLPQTAPPLAFPLRHAPGRDPRAGPRSERLTQVGAPPREAARGRGSPWETRGPSARCPQQAATAPPGWLSPCPLLLPHTPKPCRGRGRRSEARSRGQSLRSSAPSPGLVTAMTAAASAPRLGPSRTLPGTRVASARGRWKNAAASPSHPPSAGRVPGRTHHTARGRPWRGLPRGGPDGRHRLMPRG